MKRKFIRFGLSALLGAMVIWLMRESSATPSGLLASAKKFLSPPASTSPPGEPIYALPSDPPPLLLPKPPDASRKRDSLGSVLPFREATLDPALLAKIQKARPDAVLSLTLFPDVAFRLKVTGRWDDAQGIRVAMTLLDYPAGDRFFISWYQGSVRGLVEIASRNLAYEILQEGNNSIVVKEWLLTDRVCATPKPDASATRGIPPALSFGGTNGLPQAIEPGQVPILRSNPSTNRVVYLDFDGETVTSTAWANGATIVALPARLTAAQIQ